MNPKENKVATEAVNRAIDLVREHFDCVQVLASGPADDGSTDYIMQGSGNYYGRIGMAREFLNRCYARTDREINSETDEED